MPLEDFSIENINKGFFVVFTHKMYLYYVQFNLITALTIVSGNSFLFF